MTEKEITMEELEETVKRTDEQLDLMEWKMDNVEKSLVEPTDTQDVCVMNLLKSVSEPLGISVDKRSEKNLCTSVMLLTACDFLVCSGCISHTCIGEVRSDYQQLRRELMEVQTLQRELSTRLRTQLRVVHGKFARLRQRIAAASPPR